MVRLSKILAAFPIPHSSGVPQDLLQPERGCLAVQVATWMKKTFALKPALERARKQRADQRLSRNNQIDTMF